MNTASMVASWVVAHPAVIVVPACLIAGTLLLVVGVQIGGDPLPDAVEQVPERHAGWDEHPEQLAAMVDEHRTQHGTVPVIPSGLGDAPTEVIQVVRPAVPQQTPAPPAPPPVPGWFERRGHQQGDRR